MISLRVQMPMAVPAQTARSERAILDRFLDEAGKAIVDAVQGVLGTAQIYTLSEPYRKRKLAGKTRPPMRRIPGKAVDQPLILSAHGIYLGLRARREGDRVIVDVDPARGVSPEGFDYAEYWESGEGAKDGSGGVDYLGEGLALVEEMLADRPLLPAVCPGPHRGPGHTAYSAWMNGAENGITLGGVIGAGAAGWALAGLPGAAVGVGLDLLGGLFGHRKPKEPESQKNPAFYNAPSDFEYEAYRYRITGKSSVASMHFFDSREPVVQVTIPVYVDGVKTSVTREVQRATASSRVALANPVFDLHRPVP